LSASEAAVQPRTGLPRGAIRLAFDPLLGAIFWGKIFTASGTWVHGVVAAIVVFNASHSALAVGLVSTAQFAPQLVLGPLCGKLADLYDERRLILLGQCLCTLGSGGLAVWILMNPQEDWALVWSVLLASLLTGLGIVLAGPAMQAVVPRLVPVEELPAAMALNTAPMMLARVVGPVAGAFAAAHAGAAAAFGIAAVAQFVFVPLLLSVKFPSRIRSELDDDDRSVRSALRYTWADRPLLLMLLAVTAAGMGSEPTITLAPSLAHELNGGASLVGGLTAAFGLGAISGLVALPGLRRRLTQERLTSLGLGLLAVGMGTAAAAGTADLVIVAFALAGMGFVLLLTSATTLLQLRTPAHLRGRIMALWLIAFVGSRPVAGALVGAITDALSVRIALIWTALLMLAVAALCRPSKLRTSEIGAG
jgi:MFS family permease